MVDLVFTCLAALSLLGSVVILVYLTTTERRAPRFVDSIKRTTIEPNPGVKVSLIIPARNEENDITHCLESIINQTHVNLEIIVVDDSSDDSTFEIVKSFTEKHNQVRLVSAGTKPEGWVGKSWPCWKGYESSTGDFLLFVDADSSLDSTTIEISLNYVLKNNIDMFSLSPRVEMQGNVPRAVLPMISGAINLLYPMEKVNDKRSDRAYVFGTFILVKRKIYESTGGHKTVKDEIVEDAAIARKTKESGFNLRVERGPEFVSTRWEIDARSVYDGLERVVSTSVRRYGLVSILNAVLIFFITLYPILFVIIYAIFHPSSQILAAGCLASLVGIGIFFTLAALETNTISGKFRLSALLYPLGSIFFISAIISTSIKVSRRRGINWKGQEYVQPMLDRS